MPDIIPATIPDEEPTAAIVAGVILHMPPPVPSPKIVADPAHTCSVPVMPPGASFTVTTTEALQPVVSV